MKKVAIVTLYGNNNFGNKLQNYALQETIKKIGEYEVITLKEQDTRLNNKIKRFIKKFLNNKIDSRTKRFLDFNKNINYSKDIYSRNKPRKIDNYDYYIVGSDQVWNPKFTYLDKIYMLDFTDSDNKISYAASFGVNEIDDKSKNIIKNNLKRFKSVSVREDAAKKILEDCNIHNIKVVLDPTMLLTKEEWDKLSTKPFNHNDKEKYILTYFLGELDNNSKNEISRIAIENNCKIINILDPYSEYYSCGPSEFLYLEKNAFLICTDSFHSSVFSLIFNRPFIIFDRKDKNKSMNSRIDTLLNTFCIKNRRFNKKINKENLDCDYSKTNKILENKRKESIDFLFNSLDRSK